MTMNTYKYTVNGKDYTVEIEEIEGNKANVNVNGRPFEIELKKPMKSTTANKPVHIEAPKPTPVAVQQPAAAPAPQQEVGAGAKITSPLPGTVTDIMVKVGDTVKSGDTVVILEAMKMQNNIEAETSGTIASINVNKGDAVMEGDTLVTIA